MDSEKLSSYIDEHRFETLVFAAGVLLSAAVGIVFATKLDSLGSMPVLLLLPLAVLLLAAGFGVLRYPWIVLAVTVFVVAPSTTAEIHQVFRVPLLTKYIHWVLFALLLLQFIRSIPNPYVPAVFRTRSQEFFVGTHTEWARHSFLIVMSLVAFYLFTLILSVVNASDQAAAREELEPMLRQVLLMLSVMFSVGMLGRHSSLTLMLRIAVYACALYVFLAILGSFHSFDSPMAGKFTSVLPGSDEEGVGDRIAGTFDHPNTLGRYVVMLLPIAFALLVTTRKLIHRVALGVTLVVLFAGLILSESRGALLALIVLGPPLMLLFRRHLDPRFIVATLVIGVLMISVAVSHVDLKRFDATWNDIQRIVLYGESPTDNATVGRLSEMKVAVEMYKDHPVLGIGLGNYELYFQNFSFDHGNKLYAADRGAHSLYLETLAERGVVGLTGQLALFTGILVLLFSIANRIKRTDYNTGLIVYSMGFALAAYYFCGLFLHDASSDPFWLFTGLALSATRIGQLVRPRAGGGYSRRVAVDNNSTEHLVGRS